MAAVQIIGWEKGIDTQRCVDVLQSFARFAPADAKQALEAVLRGERREVPMRSEADAKLLVAALNKLGARAQLVPLA